MERLRLRRPSPAMLIALFALCVALGGTVYAATKINGTLIRKGSEPGNRLKKNTVTGKQVKEQSLGKVPSANRATSAANADTLDGLDSGALLQTASRGVAVVGVRVSSTGTVLSYFNRNGGAPTLTTGNPGQYTITFPGFSFNANVQLAQAVLVASPGEIDVDGTFGKLFIDTRNSSGTLAAREFAVVVFDASPSG